MTDIASPAARVMQRRLAHLGMLLFAALIAGSFTFGAAAVPYLAPVPMRGRSCEPACVAHTARFLADLRGVSDGELAATTSANFHALFAKTGLPGA